MYVMFVYLCLLIHFCFLLLFPRDCMMWFNFFAVRVEESPSKSDDSPPEKTVVKERVLEKIDLSKGT